MKRFIISEFVFLSLVFVGIFLVLMGCSEKLPEVCYDDGCFEVEVMSSDYDRGRGMMFREELDDDKGMLFVFPYEGVYPFWMKNTRLYLDIIWIDENYEIVYISENTPPCKEDPCTSYNPMVNAAYVLEINGGLSDDIGLVKGTELKFKDIDDK